MWYLVAVSKVVWVVQSDCEHHSHGVESVLSLHPWAEA